MIRRFGISLGLCVLLVIPSGVCHADGWSEFWHRCKVDYHRNKSWPVPFQAMDRQATVAPFAVMVDNGWRLHNTITHQMFNVETHQLNAAGLHHVQWIVSQAPEHRRSLFVLQATNAEATSIRLDAVQRAAASMMREGELPPVMVTHIEPPSASGDYFDRVQRAVDSSMPAPRLPRATNIQP